MVHSVMFLVLAFLNAAALFILLGAEFLAMLLIVVYVGAIAVLFLFVVMMLDVDLKEIEKSINRHIPILILVGALLFFEILAIIKFSLTRYYQSIEPVIPTPLNITNTEALGNILYTDFILPFQISAMILLVAMIGAIILTLRNENYTTRKQNISDQNARNRANSLSIVKVATGKGIKNI